MCKLPKQNTITFGDYEGIPVDTMPNGSSSSSIVVLKTLKMGKKSEEKGFCPKENVFMVIKYYKDNIPSVMSGNLSSSCPPHAKKRKFSVSPLKKPKNRCIFENEPLYHKEDLILNTIKSSGKFRNSDNRPPRSLGPITTIDNRKALIMEYKGENDLMEYISKHLRGNRNLPDGFTMNKFRGMIDSIFDQVKGFHSIGLVHGDLRLENIILGKEECWWSNISIIDFGTSLYNPQIVTDVDDSGAPKLKYTLSSIRGGYLSPQKIWRRQEKHTPFCVDVWCLGIVIFLFLFRYFPFEYLATKNDRPTLEQLSELNRNILPPPKSLLSHLRYYGLFKKDMFELLSQHILIEDPNERYDINTFKEKINEITYLHE